MLIVIQQVWKEQIRSDQNRIDQNRIEQNRIESYPQHNSLSCLPFFLNTFIITLPTTITIIMTYYFQPCVLASPVYQKYSKPGLLLPDVKAEQETLIQAHMEAVKRCKETDLKRVYELDYAMVMGIPMNGKSNEQKKEKEKFSQRRSFGIKGHQGGTTKKYRRFQIYLFVDTHDQSCFHPNSFIICLSIFQSDTIIQYQVVWIRPLNQINK